MRSGGARNIHSCELTLSSDLALPSFLPPFVRSSSWLEKWKLWCLMSEKHPRTGKWVDSLASVRRERRRQAQLSDWWIVHPFSPVRFVWETLMTLVYAIAFITVPFMTSFVVLDYERVRVDTINPVIYLFFWLDITFNCFTAFADERVHIPDGQYPAALFVHYSLVCLSVLRDAGLHHECEDCWVSNIATEEIPARYHHALFIVIQNFVASGFGGIEPRTQGHTIICTILMFLGRIFEGYVIGMFLQIRAVSKAAESKYQEIMNQLSAYTRQKQLPPYMRRRLFSFYHHRYRNSYFREKTILASLSEQLRQEILLHSSQRLVEGVAVFRTLPKEILASIVANLKFELYLPNDVIVKAGTQGDCMFLLASGTVAVLTPTGKEVCHLEDGAHFGEVALLVQDQKRVASVVAIEVCEVYRLDRRDFRKCVAMQSDLYEKIERIATERMHRTMMIEEQHKNFLKSAHRATRSSRTRSFRAGPVT